MPKKLSPQAKREFMTSPANKAISALVNVHRTADRAALTHAIGEIRGKVVSWSDESHLVGVRIHAGGLDALAELDGVAYVETGGRFAD